MAAPHELQKRASSETCLPQVVQNAIENERPPQTRILQ
jgi:hypothetical protein